jgi:hypothetical protein
MIGLLGLVDLPCISLREMREVKEIGGSSGLVMVADCERIRCCAVSLWSPLKTAAKTGRGKLWWTVDCGRAQAVFGAHAGH